MAPTEPAASAQHRPQEPVGATWSYRAFGLTWLSSFSWPAPEERADGDVDVELQLADDIDTLWSGQADTPDWLFRIDGSRFVIQRGTAGDFRLLQQDGARFHLSSDGTRISYGPEVATDPSSQRLLLDTVLWTTTLLRGRDALHASAVQHGAGVVAFLAPSGGGKTSLAFELMRRGYPLFSDDVLVIDRGDAEFLAHPAPPLMNLSVAADMGGIDVEPIALIGDEWWVSVLDAARKPAPLRHLVLLHREAGVEDRVVPVLPTSLDLLPYAHFHAHLASWERRRFELCSDLALAVPVSRVEVGLETSVSRTADLVEHALSMEAP